MAQDKLRTEGWRVGRRVCREDTQEFGTIVEADHQIKVKWDNGQTSYFERDKLSNVKLAEP
jgi:transcriptional regulator NrdR family protein